MVGFESVEQRSRLPGSAAAWGVKRAIPRHEHSEGRRIEVDQERPARPVEAIHQDSREDSRADVIRRDMVKRIRRACAHLSDEEFLRLVDAMVEKQLRSERRRTLD